MPVFKSSTNKSKPILGAVVVGMSVCPIVVMNGRNVVDAAILCMSFVEAIRLTVVDGGFVVVTTVGFVVVTSVGFVVVTTIGFVVVVVVVVVAIVDEDDDDVDDEGFGGFVGIRNLNVV